MISDRSGSDSQTDEPLVSVVLPTYNRAHTLARAMQSVLAQTYRNLELIVIDDGSTDGTEQLVRQWPDARVRYVHSGGRRGVSVARNIGVQQARGDWIAFQDSDDEWRLEKLAKQMEVVRSHADVGLVVCGHQCINFPPLSYLGVRDARSVLDFSDMLLLRLPGASTWLASRAAIQAEDGFDVNLNCFEDWELALRLSRRWKVFMVNEPLLLYYKTPGSLFSTESGYAYNLKQILERHHERLRPHPAIWAFYCNLIGQTECRYGSLAEGRCWFREALRARPSSWRAWLNLLASFAGRAVFEGYVQLARKLRQRFANNIQPALYTSAHR